MYIDGTVYPDLPEPPVILETPWDKADYVHRICTAWDFHILPEQETLDLFSQWKDVFDRFPIVTSPGYHAFRAWFGWERIPCPPHLHGPEPLYRILDRLEDRPEDPCEHMI